MRVHTRWPYYSTACQRDVARLLRQGGSLTAYQANPQHGVEPREGSWARRLETLAAKKTHRYAIACQSGTSALWTAIRAADWKPGEIITSALTFSATASAIVLAGHAPVFADVEETGGLDWRSVQTMMTSKTRAILVVDLFGKMVESRLFELGYPVIEDACQAVGAQVGSVWAGARGFAGAWSFNGAKNVPGGEGGLLLTWQEALAQRARYFLNHAENFGSSTVGLNGHLDELSACVAYHGLLAVERRNQARRQLATRLASYLEEAGARGPHVGLHHALYVYPLRVTKRRRELAQLLRAKGYHVSEGYLQPILADYPAFSTYRSAPLLVTRRLSRSELLVLFDPLRPSATFKDVDRLGHLIQQWAMEGRTRAFLL